MVTSAVLYGKEADVSTLNAFKGLCGCHFVQAPAT